jgi:hypothetical protein
VRRRARANPLLVLAVSAVGAWVALVEAPPIVGVLVLVPFALGIWAAPSIVAWRTRRDRFVPVLLANTVGFLFAGIG